MNRDKEWFLKSLEGITLTDDYGNEFNGGYEEGLDAAYELALQLDEQRITQEQAWEVLAPRFSMTAIELEREVLDGFLAMTAEEIEMESYKIKQLADRVKKLHAENEELKAELDETEKVVIPRFVADHIEFCKSENKRLNVALSESPESKMVFEMGVNWEEANEIYARAWLDGYEVEKEKLYQVIIPTKDEGWKYYFLDKDRGINMENNLKYVDSHTEEFIRSVSDDLWSFAVEVAE